MASRKSAPRKKQPPIAFPIVCMGASAGGLEAVTRLLRSLPPQTGMGFVVILHLDPTHPSALSPLLAKASPLPVSEARNGAKVRPDHVYVIPPNAVMSYSNGALRLAPRSSQTRFLPIDHFMRSLAGEAKNRAVAVILSGNATDGTLGVEAIKAEGGITFAQDELSAQYPGMPTSAAASGCIDFVLPPEEIARELLKRLPDRSRARGTDGDHDDFGVGGAPEELKQVFNLLRKTTGLDFNSYKRTTIRRRIARRMTLHKFETLNQYLAYLQKTRPEVEALSQDMLIKVTTFFRDPEAFEALRRKVFPSILNQKKSGDPLRIWVPGCSTGEEVYSIAMTLLETAGDLSPGVQCQIFATDISESAIERARNAFYGEGIKQDVSPEHLRRFFVKTAEGFRLAKPVRDLCIFARQDLTKDPPFSKLDLISCRNVLIYMDSDLQKRIIPIFHYALKPGGFLMLGSAESTGSFSTLFTLVDKKGKVYARKQGVEGSRQDYRLPAVTPVRPPAGREERMSPPTTEADLLKEADKITLARYSPPGVLLNDELEVLQFRGHTAPYLEQAPGKPTVSILKLVREGMAFELRDAAQKALKGGTPVRTGPIELSHDRQARRVAIEVVPIRSDLSDKPFLLVLFSEPSVAPSRTGKRPAPISRKAEGKLVQQLRRELNNLRDELQSVIEEQEAAQEEFKSANEEILSSNEELQSTNEELETAKEELQSANEELTTLNEELLTRNTELSQLNSDVTNLLASISIPILMLSQELRIRRFTPAAGALLNVIPADVGRPITDIRPNFDVPNLQELVSEVIETMAVREREVRAKDGHWYSMRIRPYRTVDNKIEGATLTFLGIDDLRKSQLAEAVVDTMREPLLVLDRNLVVRSANRAFYRIFAVEPRDTIDKAIYDLGSGQWNLPELRTLLEETLTRRTTVEDFRVDHTFPSIGQKIMMLNARRLKSQYGNDELILVAIEDMTPRTHDQPRG